MFPETINLGPLKLSWYGLAVAAGALAALALASFNAPRRNLKPEAVREFSFWMILAGLLGSRLAYALFHAPEFAGDAWGVLAYWRGGLMFQGGLVGALLVAPWALKKFRLPFRATADVLAPSLALGQALGRLGCFAAGCCYGRHLEDAPPWALIFPPGSLAPPGLPLWPTQLVESFFLAALAGVLTWLLRRRTKSGSLRPGIIRPGLIAALYLAGAGALRLVLESFRGDFRGQALIFDLPPTTVAAGVSAALGLILAALAARSRPPLRP